ncbi:hypothetical protein BC938DRAFT_471845, partial [Jimgerdemannia flammicorona]
AGHLLSCPADDLLSSSWEPLLISTAYYINTRFYYFWGVFFFLQTQLSNPGVAAFWREIDPQQIEITKTTPKKRPMAANKLSPNKESDSDGFKEYHKAPKVTVTYSRRRSTAARNTNADASQVSENTGMVTPMSIPKPKVAVYSTEKGSYESEASESDSDDNPFKEPTSKEDERILGRTFAMVFYEHTNPKEWTSTKVVAHYRANIQTKDLKKILDYVKKDLKKVATTVSRFDGTRRQKAEEIIDTWEDWTASVKNSQQKLRRKLKDVATRIELLETKQQVKATVNAANQMNIIQKKFVGLSHPRKHRRENDEEGVAVTPNTLQAESDRSDDDKDSNEYGIDSAASLEPRTLDDNKDVQTYDEIEVMSNIDDDITNEPQMAVGSNNQPSAAREVPEKILDTEISNALKDDAEELTSHDMDLFTQNLVHSFIIDPEDKFVQSGFNLEELTEIRETKNMQEPPEIEAELLESISTFSKTSTKDIRKALYSAHPRLNQNYNPLIDFPYEHVRTTVSDWVRLLEMEPNPFTQDLPESWFRINVWRTIDIAFSDTPYVIFVGGEKAGLASAERKNRGRALSNINRMQRKAIGKKGDGYVRTIGSRRIDWAASEAGPEWDGEHGTKLMKECGLSLPKTLKDIFVCLARKVSYSEDKIRKLNIPGFVHADPILIARRAVCRYVKEGPYEIYADVNHFNKTLDALVAIIYAKVKSNNCTDNERCECYSGGRCEKVEKPTGIKRIGGLRYPRLPSNTQEKEDQATT